MTLFERLMGYERLTVTEGYRVLLLEKGRINAILEPGEHKVRSRNTEQVSYAVGVESFDGAFTPALIHSYPDLRADHFYEVKTGNDELALVMLDGRVRWIVPQNLHRLYWLAAGTWSVERIDLSGSHEVAPKLARRLMRSGVTAQLTSYEVGEGKVGLLSVDGVFERLLGPGTYWFWNLGRKHLVRLVDTRWQAHEVTGQEILTRDRVTLRVNLSADYRVTDPVKAVHETTDFAEALHRSIQLAFRKTLGALTLDALLADKVSVDAEAAQTVRSDMARIGIEVGEIALKDVILPGEMREILNQVVAAQKEAEANVIRRREETNATRSLLNTAKVMAENPVMLRLKELEALESIAGKVERLTVHNGTEGLLSDVVRLRP